jgi:hypothetical protein
MREWGLSPRDGRAWLRQRLIVQAFIGRRVRLFVRIPDSRIVRYYQHHQ